MSLESESRSVVSDSLQPHGLSSPWNSLGQNTGVGSLSLLQWVFPTQESNRDLQHCRWILYQLRHQGSPVPRPQFPHLYNKSVQQAHRFFSSVHMAHGKCSLSGCSCQEMVCTTVPATFPTQLCSLPPAWIRCSLKLHIRSPSRN